MSILASLMLAATLFSMPLHILVLRDGHHLGVSGDITLQEDRLVFTGIDGGLYSMPVSEVDFSATEKAQKSPVEATPPPTVASGTRFGNLKIRVTAEEKDRLLKAIQDNHGGSPAPVQHFDHPAPGDEVSSAEGSQEEWAWKQQAQQLEEALRQREEELKLLKDSEQQLQDQILGLLGRGYRANQFSYQVGQLQQTRDAIPEAELAVTRAERALDQFRDNARRQGILPGWLR